ncbi:Dipeptidyl-peptidase 5 [Entomophthora muscae]|uniref:Dipeptidyl-peptidase 5 n=1 Tax=Entomophthora muscae TaxID=34485 RepID=A0ACC2UFL2_9FUNG|nr:Dipeptidyl-peptidase 5 [Entomophthora muscae]
MKYNFLGLLAFLIICLGYCQAKLYFTSEELVSWPRPSKIVLSPEKTHGLYFTSAYDPRNHSTTVKAHVIEFSIREESKPKTHDITILFSKLGAVLKSPPSILWLDQVTLGFVFDNHFWSLCMPEDFQDIIRYPSLIRPPSNVSPLKGLEEVDDLTFHPKTGTLIFSAKVIRRSHREDFGDSALVFDQLFVRHWDTFINPDSKRQLFSVRVKRGKENNPIWYFASEPMNLLQGTELESPVAPFGDSGDYSLSPDGKELAFISKFPGREQAWTTKSDVYVVSLDGQSSPKSLTDSLGASSQPQYSPDGKYIAWLQMKEPQYEADKNRIFVYERETGKITKLASWWDRSPSSLEWSGDSDTLLMIASEFGKSKVFNVKVSTNKLRQVTKYDSASDLQLLCENVFVATLSNLVAPPEFYTIALNNQTQITRQSNVNTERIKNYSLSEPEEFWFPGADGHQVHGLLLRPPTFSRWKKYPLAFLIHGGPQSAWENSWSNRWNPNVFANAGYIVVAVNPHGSTGYGQKFTDSIKQDWGGKPFKDLMLGLDYVIDNYESVDKERMCALGASYGGYMVNWINGHTDRFRCLVNHDGMFDAKHAYYTTDELYFNEHDFGGVPWASPKKFEKFSPSSYVWKWATPTLVIHSAKDYRLVDGEGLATFTALQRRGIASRLVYFPDENHWVLKPANSLRWHSEVFTWINRYANLTDSIL